MKTFISICFDIVLYSMLSVAILSLAFFSIGLVGALT